jgi:hypothetical protein
MSARAIWFSLVGSAVVFAVVVTWPVPAYSHKPITTNILFKNEIAQIFQRKCFQCHSDNNLSMSLTTYTEARPWARAIREEVLERNMPPWQAVPGYGQFSNDISLNSREKEIILSWADGGAPSGVLKAEESVPPVFVPPAPAWDHGTPDQVVAVGAGHTVPSGAAFEVKRFVVSTGLTAPKRVRAMALKQGDRRVVRYATFSDAATGRWLGAWTPWQTSSNLADGVAIQLPAQAKIAVEIGYSGAEQDVTDKSELGLYFADSKSPVATSASFSAAGTSLAADPTSQRVRAETKLAADTKLLALWPNPGPGARSVEITATTPEGILKPLLWIQDFRPAWRSPYLFAAAEPLPAGTRVIMTTYYDNPTAKPAAVRTEAWMLTTTASR